VFPCVEAENQIIIGCGVTENADDFAADLVGVFCALTLPWLSHI